MGSVDLAAVLDAWPECARVLTLAGEIVHVNPAGEALMENTLDRVRGRAWPLLWPPETRGPMYDAIAEAAGGKVGSFRGVCINEAGRRLYLDTVISPIRDTEGRVVQLLAVSRDISAALESQTFLETLVRLLPNPILAKNARDGRYILINEAAERAFGLSSAQFIGRDAWQLFPQNEARGFAQEDAEVIASRELRVSEEEPITTTEGVRYFTTKKFATYDGAGGEALHLVTLGEDVTERRDAAIALKSALTEAENANLAKSEFLANMSHEIRTPLNGIVAGADMLARCDLDPRARDLVEIIASSGATLERLLSDILDLARIEAGRIELETTVFRLGDLVRGAAALAKLQADEKGVAVEVEVDPSVDRAFEGDPHRLRQVLLNLLSNAVKFTERGAVTVTAAPRGGGVRIAVRDTGIGFKPEMKEQLFGRFHQADGSITRRFGGTGLGMTISRELAQLMGGALDAEGREGEGATFWVDLPLAPAEMAAPEAPAASAEAPERALRILLADDHPTNRKVVELMLAGMAEVVSVENGAEALMALGTDVFDVVLMDMQMPVMDGLEATRRIRELEGLAGRAPTPVVMLTANALPEHVAASHAAGADRHLEKPVTLAGLLGALNDVLAWDEDTSEAAVTA